MLSIYDYIKYYGEYSFLDIPFNDVDNIIFSTLSYLPLEKIDYHEEDKIDAILEKLEKIDINNKTLGYKSVDILKLIYNTKRYNEIKLTNFCNILDDKTQFSAISIVFLDYLYVSFRGTDNSIVGWKEDFELCYNYPTIAQINAKEYLENISNKYEKIIVGGHSKGGNLAVASVIGVSDLVQEKVLKVYNNDGPGFLDSEVNSLSFSKVLNKIVTIIPEESSVGIIMKNPNIKVIKSSKTKIGQHDLTSWECFGSILIPGSLSNISIMSQNKIISWINSTTTLDRKRVVESFFEILKRSNIKEFRELKNVNIYQLQSMIKEANSISKDDEKMILETLKMFFRS